MVAQPGPFPRTSSSDHGLPQGPWESERRRQRGGKGRARRTAIWGKSKMDSKCEISQGRAQQEPLSIELAVGNFQVCGSFAEINYLWLKAGEGQGLA